MQVAMRRKLRVCVVPSQPVPNDRAISNNRMMKIVMLGMTDGIGSGKNEEK